MTPHRRILARTLFLAAASLPAAPALAQTVSGGDPYEGPLMRCRADLAQRPQDSLRVASDLLAKPELPMRHSRWWASTSRRGRTPSAC
jgi:hypothetical protein